MELTTDERRLIEASRAAAAIESRPVETSAAAPPTRLAIVALVELAAVLEPKHEVWPAIIELLNQYGI